MQTKPDNPRYDYGTYFDRGRFQAQTVTRLQTLDPTPFNGNWAATTNAVIYSEFNQITAGEEYAGLSLKWVMDGCEQYIVNNQLMQVKQNRYLLLNAGRALDIDFHNTKTARGACIYFSNELTRSIYHGLRATHESLLDSGPDAARSSELPGLHEDIYSTRYDQLGQILEGLGLAIQRQGALRCFLPPEFFVETASVLISTQLNIRSSMESISASRSGTREELFRRVRRARELIDDDTTADHDLKTLAATALLSEFHFLRTFKDAFGMTPHQYLIHRRLAAAELRLRHSTQSISDIAHDSGFADLQAFCRSFRRVYRTSPLQFRKNCH